MKKAVVLVSGGLDSATTLAIAKNQGFSCYALSFDYGQKNAIELEAAKEICKKMGVVEHKIIKIGVGELGGSALTDNNIDIPTYVEEDSIPVTYVPARNTIFLSIALGYAEVLDSQDIFMGITSKDYSGYPDCKPEFIKAFTDLANIATKAGIEGKPFVIHTPLIYLKKSEVIQRGVELGVDFSKTITCHKPSTEGLACGECDGCYYRKLGFKEAHLVDAIPYARTAAAV